MNIHPNHSLFDFDQRHVALASSQNPLPFILQAKTQDLPLVDWSRENINFLEAKLYEVGAILFRNFSPMSTEDFERFLRATGGDLVRYRQASTPRSHISGSIYSSTEYPPDQIIPLHNEISYACQWPMKLGFQCVTPANSEGETPLADSRQVYENIPVRIRQKFEEKGVRYVRNYGTGLDLSWETAFATTNRAEVERYCEGARIEAHWYGKNALRTTQISQATATHPHTHESVWFNQAHLFHTSNLPIDIRNSLLDCVPEANLPRQAYYGDGTPLEMEDLEHIRQVYQDQMVLFTWQQHDILLIDNMLTAHGRAPFTGSRKILVGMTNPYTPIS